MATFASSRSTHVRGVGFGPVSLIGRVFGLLGLQSSRRSLAHLDDALLRDIGVTRDQARKESARPIWDVPANWRA